jgi:hypothetical protein
MTKKTLDEQELLKILELAKKAAKQSEEMCEIIISHRAKYKRWYEEAKAVKKQ